MITPLFIPDTKRTPEFSSSLKDDTVYIVIRGQSLAEDVRKLYKPFRTWFKAVETSAFNVHCTLSLDYFDTGSTKELYEILECMRDIAQNTSRAVRLIWEYPEYDEDLCATARELLEEMCSLQTDISFALAKQASCLSTQLQMRL